MASHTLSRCKETGIETAIRLAGGQQMLADHLGVTQQAVSEWKVRGYAPKKQVEAIEQLTGVDRRQLIDPALIELLEE